LGVIQSYPVFFRKKQVAPKTGALEAAGAGGPEMFIPKECRAEEPVEAFNVGNKKQFSAQNGQIQMSSFLVKSVKYIELRVNS